VVKGKLIYTPCRNVFANDPYKHDVFQIEEEDYAAVEDKGEIVAIVHSHVGEPPIPSMSDKVGIEAHGVPWLIVNHPVGNFTITEPSGYKAPPIGRPYVYGSLDCFSLCRDYYKEIGIHFKDYARGERWWEKGENLYMDNFEEAGFFLIEQKDLREHDAILMMARSAVPNHAAIYLGNNLILQHCEGRLSSRDVYGGYWMKCATHFLRHRSLA